MATQSEATENRPASMKLHVPAEYARDMWQECLDDYVGDEVQAKLVYDRVMQSLARCEDLPAKDSCRQARRRAKRARHDSSQSEADASASAHSTENTDSDPSYSNSQFNHSTSDSEVGEDGDSEQQKLKLKWCKPGALSRRVGVGLSVLRNWAKANLVRTIVSPGGHRLFHVQSVLQHIEQGKDSFSKARRNKLQVPNTANTKFQLVAYVCVDMSNRNRAQLEAVGEQITSQVIQHYGITEDNCSIVVELQTDAKRPEQLSTSKTVQVTDTPGIRLLLTKISSRSCSKVVLRRTEDISSTPSTYAFFLLLCQSLNISVEIVPELFKHTS
jgi:hypothetical protein